MRALAGAPGGPGPGPAEALAARPTKPGPRAEMSARYRVVAAAIGRTGAALDTPKAAAHTLRVGQEIVVTEQVWLGQQLRLKFDGGWTSPTALAGTVLLESVPPELRLSRPASAMACAGGAAVPLGPGRGHRRRCTY